MKYQISFGVSDSMNKMELLHVPGAVLVFFDTETTGLDKSRDLAGRIIEDEICQLSAEKHIVNEDLRMNLLDRREWYIKPSVPVSPEASAVSHITNEMLADKPTWADLHEEIRDFFGNHVVIAHNLFKFDLKMIQRMYRRMGDEFAPCAMMDTLNMARLCYPNAPSRSLEPLIKSLNLDWKVKALSSNGSYHDASTDVTAMVVLYEEMRKNGLADVRRRWNVPRIQAVWRTPETYNHKNQATYVKTVSGLVRLLHYYNKWESDEIDFSQVNTLAFENAVFELTGTSTLTELKKYGLTKSKAEKKKIDA